MSAMSKRLAEGLALHQAGRLEEAERIYEEVVAREPRNADAQQFLGLVRLRRGDLEGAVERIGRAVALNPKVGAYHYNLGLALQRRGDVAGSLASYRRAVGLSPDLAEAHNNLGNLLRETGALEAAVESCRRAVALRGDWAEAHLNLGTALQAAGRFDEALSSLYRAIGISPNLASAHQAIGNVLQQRGQFADAIAAYRRSLQHDPNAAQTYLNLGNALQVLGQIDEAMASFSTVLKLNPQSAEACTNLGNAYLALNDRIAAVAWHRRAIENDPSFALAWNNLGVVMQMDGRHDEARAAYERAASLQPNADAHNNLGLLLPFYGEVEQALQHFRRAIELRPDFSTAYRNLLGVMLYSGLGADERYGVAREFEARYAAKAVGTAAVRGAGSKRLKIGYVSSDFYEHPVGRNLEPVLAHRDRAGFDVVLYADVMREDAASARLKGLADRWVSLAGLSDAEVAERVRSDGIDILVLLAGRFDRNRPLVAGYRAAPVQVSFHDPGTSGLEAMDYLIADRVLVPGKRPVERFTERVVRLPSFYVHAPLAGVTVGEAPSRNLGRVTFGSFNNPAKVGPEVLGLWRRVLEAVPGSLLRVRFKNWFANTGLRERFTSVLGDRVEFETEEAGLEGHLASYNRIDVALDPFPFTGSTTTFEALWMGVPVVTLRGEAMAGRWSASMLRSVGLRDLVAGSAEEYVALAAGLARDGSRRAELRRTLRARVAASPLCDGRARARQLERLYRALWKHKGSNG